MKRKAHCSPRRHEEISPRDRASGSNSSAEVVQFIGTVTDITERKRAEQRLRGSEARFRTFVDHATDAFMLFGEDKTVVDVNRQACEALGTLGRNSSG